MPSHCFGKSCFDLVWWKILLALLGMGLFIRLGFWQVHRAIDKQAMLNLYQAQKNRLPQLWKPTSPLPHQYEKVSVKGREKGEFFLLDNQYHAHQWGVHVLSVFQLADNTGVLVDRGWINASPRDKFFSTLRFSHEPQLLRGQIYYPSHNRWIQTSDPQGLPHRGWLIEQFELKGIEKSLHQRVQPFIIRLDKEEPNGWIREWEIVSMPPVKHRAYAVQWFALASLVFILFIVTSYKKKGAS